jgi:multisubunit Na+/H+ antiporter MnhB subunit
MMSSLLFRTATRLILPLALLFAAYMSFKGHNEPGGGFIGGLIAAVALMLYSMAHGREALIELLPVHPRVLVATGFFIALLTATVPLIFGYPMLRSFDHYLGLFGQEVHLVTPAVFDIGVMLVVIGVSTGMIQRLGDELPRDRSEELVEGGIEHTRGLAQAGTAGASAELEEDRGDGR